MPTQKDRTAVITAATHHHPNPAEVTMPAKKPKTSKKVAPSVSPIATGTAATGGETPLGASATTTTPVSSTAAGVAMNAPPDITIPAPPTGFVPVSLVDYRGSHPKAGQIAAVPNAVAELNANAASYTQTFGPAVPPAPQLAGKLTNASQWTAMRVAIEAFLIYVKSNEAVAWKSALTDLEELNAIFQVIEKQNPVLLNGFPEVEKLLGVDKAVGQRAAATRARKAKAKVAGAGTAATVGPIVTGTAAPAASAPAASATTVTVSSGGSGTGGAAH